MNNKKPNYVYIESACRNDERESTIDFLSFYPEDGIEVDGVTVRVKLDYDKNQQKATLWVEAIDASSGHKILMSEVRNLHVTELNKNKILEEFENTEQDDLSEK